MQVVTLRQSGVLNSATLGCELAASVVDHLNRSMAVEFDAMEVHRVTPSFANAFVMTVLDAHPDAFSASRCRISANDMVSDSFHASMDRYERGIRLSTQRQSQHPTSLLQAS